MNMMTAQWMEQAEVVSVEALLQMDIHIAEQPRPMPPAWMIAPSFRAAEHIVALGGGAVSPTAAAPISTQPYRSLREVPRTY